MLARIVGIAITHNAKIEKYQLTDKRCITLFSKYVVLRIFQGALR